MENNRDNPKHAAMVTGATGAIGRAIARQLAGQAGYEVILACRNEQKASQAVREIRQATGNPHAAIWG